MSLLSLMHPCWLVVELHIHCMIIWTTVNNACSSWLYANNESFTKPAVVILNWQQAICGSTSWHAWYEMTDGYAHDEGSTTCCARLQCWLASLSTAPRAHVEYELIDWFNKWYKLLNSFWVNECSASMAEPEGLSCGLKMHFAHWLYIVCMILLQPLDIPPLDGLLPPI